MGAPLTEGAHIPVQSLNLLSRILLLSRALSSGRCVTFKSGLGRVASPFQASDL